MSDPDRLGPYSCCGPMRAVELPSITEGVCAFLCEQCGCYRHALPFADARRKHVDQQMAVILAALVGERA